MTLTRRSRPMLLWASVLQRITFEAGVEPAAIVLDPNTVMLMQADDVKRPAPPADRRRPR